MGIKGLSKLIQSNAEGALRLGPIKSYFGRSIAIDATMALYQFLIAVRFGSDGQLTNDDGDVTSHIIGIFYRTIRMMENGIKPVYVFDGKPPDFKSAELQKRKEKREKAMEELKDAEEAGDNERVIQMQKRTTKVTKKHVGEVQTLLKFMGIPFVNAPGEAEAQCARMSAQGIVYGAGTEDMDALTFGTTKLIRHLTYSAARKEPVQEFDLNNVLKGFDCTMDQFIDICILCGCDYCPSIRGIGPKKAFEYVKKWKNIEGIIKNIKNEKRFVIPEEWQFEKARELFKKPDVLDCKDMKLKWIDPNEDELINYLVHDKGFNKDRVLKGIQRLKKCKGKSSQRRLDSFFKIMPSPANKNKNKNKKNKNMKNNKKNNKNNKNNKNKNKLIGKKRKHDGTKGENEPKNKKQKTKN